jgi:hypothetical protein
VIQMALKPATNTALRFLLAFGADVIFIFFPPLHVPDDALQDLKSGTCAAIAVVAMAPIVLRGPGWLLRIFSLVLFLPAACFLVHLFGCG